MASPTTGRAGKRRRGAGSRRGSAEEGGLAAAALRRLSTKQEVLFFGDSLAWGMHHALAARYRRTWPQLLEARLHAAGFRMVESALCSRTTCHDDACERNGDWMPGAEPHFFNGLHHFGPLFSSHTPRVLVLALGTNDLKTRIRQQSGRAALPTHAPTQRRLVTQARTARKEARVIAENCAKIGEKARLMHMGFCHAGELRVVVLTPPELVLNDESEQMGYDAFSAEISLEFPAAFQEMCLAHGFTCVDAKPPSMKCSVDGVHFTEASQAQLAEDVWVVLKKALAPKEPRRSQRSRKRSSRLEKD